MYFAQFYCKSAISDKIVEGCGDRSVFVLDGRNNINTMIIDARLFGKKHKWVGFTIHRGESFTRCTQISEMFKI